MSELQAPEPGEFRIYETEDGPTRVDTIWLSQAMMAELFQTSPQNITPHLKALCAEGKITPETTCRSYLQVRAEGERQVRRTVKFYNLDAILAVGYRNGRSSRPSSRWPRSVLPTILRAMGGVHPLDVTFDDDDLATPWKRENTSAKKQAGPMPKSTAHRPAARTAGCRAVLAV